MGLTLLCINLALSPDFLKSNFCKSIQTLWDSICWEMYFSKSKNFYSNTFFLLGKNSVRKMWDLQLLVRLKERFVCFTLNHSNMGVGVPCIGQVNFTVWPTSTFSVRAVTEARGGPEKNEKNNRWDDGYLIGFFLHLVAWSIINSSLSQI